MIDGILIWSYQDGLGEYLRSISYLNFQVRHEENRPSVKSYHTTYKSLKIAIYSSRLVSIRGSLHKFYNDGEDNNDNYTFKKLTDTLEHIESELNIDLKQATIHTIEFGFNLKTVTPPREFLNNIICYRTKVFSEENFHRLTYCQLDKVDIKFYLKGDNLETLRVELKIKKMSACAIKKLCLADLTKQHVWKAFYSQLRGTISQIKFNAQVILDHLKQDERELYLMCNNPSSWKAFNKDQRHKINKRFVELKQRHGKQDYQQLLISAIDDKYLQLCNNIA